MGIGDKFQQQTKYFPDRAPEPIDRWAEPPGPYKSYPDAPKLPLPSFTPSRPMSLDEALRRRRSVRHFADRPISSGQLSYLLWAAGGISRHEAGHAFRTAPSAGALYPVECYIVAHNVRNIEPGVYHYAVLEHQLEQLASGDFRRAIATAALGQGFCATAAAVLVWTGVFGRSKYKYGQRAYRYIYLDAGHIAENLALAATSLELASCEVGALFDDQVNALLGVDGSAESVLCMAAVGHPD